MQSVETVTVRRADKDDCWEHVTRITLEDGSSHLSLHIIPDAAFEGWAAHLGTEDADELLDYILHAPYLREVTPEALQETKERLAPAHKTPHGQLRKFVSEAGIPDKYQPTKEDQLAPLREAAQQGVDNVRKVQQVRLGTPRSPGGSDSGFHRRVTGRDGQPAGVADGDRNAHRSARRRRIVASEQAPHGAAGEAGNREP